MKKGHPPVFVGHETMTKLSDAERRERLKIESDDSASTFRRRFTQELSDGFRDLQRQIKENSKKK